MHHKENEAHPNLSGLRPPMASSGLIEASEKEQFIEVWLTHLKSSAKSLHSSLHSRTSSVSSAARSSAKAIGQGIKRIKKGADAIIRPLKRAKHALSNVSSPVIKLGVGGRGTLLLRLCLQQVMGPAQASTTASKPASGSSSKSAKMSTPAPTPASSSTPSGSIPSIEKPLVNIPRLETNGANWAIFVMRFQDAMKVSR
ncbi:hypothetical protein F5888DRAFT_1800846 [Russula emetica]|nr:hypothetical protein F5888DRAFT_1800846 [Russula emetica]